MKSRMTLGIFLICSLFGFNALAKDCTPQEIANLARGGFSNSEIEKFCGPGSEDTDSELRQKYGILEGKNWQTHYYVSKKRNKREEVFFTIGTDKIELTSSHPNVTYFDIVDLGDALRFKRRQTPYKAIYTLTIQLDTVTSNSLSVVQQYKKVTKHTWQ